MEKVCCEIAKETEAIKWNPYNQVVQCHSCGHVYEPKVYGIGRFSETTLEHLLERYPRLTREMANQLLTYEGVHFRNERPNVKLEAMGRVFPGPIISVFLVLPDEVLEAYESVGIERETSLVMDEQGNFVYKT